MLTWKVSSQSMSFAKASRNFKKTVVRRKLVRASLSVENEVKFTKSYGGRNDSRQRPPRASRDDMSIGKSKKQSDKQGRVLEAFGGKRKSKGTEALGLELAQHKQQHVAESALFAISEE